MERQVAVRGGRVSAIAATIRGRRDVSKKRRGPTPPETGPSLAETILSMTADQNDPVSLLRELNHRVKNNFQIIVSLMNLRKRTVTPERREDIRFVEEHVQSMAVAYRLAYDTGSMVEVSLTELITEVLSGLRQIVGLREEQLRLDVEAADSRISLDHAIALSLYLAVLVPPYLDEAVTTTGAVTISANMAAKLLTLSVGGTWRTPVGLDRLRGRLMRAYAVQLNAEIFPAAAHGAELLRFAVEPPAAEFFPA
jgi:Histidine kinase